MSDRIDLRMLNVARLKVERTNILRFARQIYPGWLQRVQLKDVFAGRNNEISSNELEVEAHYLAEKGLLRLEQGDDAAEWKIRITPRGIDFLDGHIEEIGLASPEMFD